MLRREKSGCPEPGTAKLCPIMTRLYNTQIYGHCSLVAQQDARPPPPTSSECPAKSECSWTEGSLGVQTGSGGWTGLPVSTYLTWRCLPGLTTRCKYGRVTDREKPTHNLRDNIVSGLTESLVSLVRPGLVTTRSGCPKVEQEHTGEQETEMLSRANRAGRSQRTVGVTSL